MTKGRLAIGVLACACASFAPPSEAFFPVKSLVRDIPNAPHHQRRVRHHVFVTRPQTEPRWAVEKGGRRENRLLSAMGNAEMTGEGSSSSSPAGDYDDDEEEEEEEEEEEQQQQRQLLTNNQIQTPFDSLGDRGGVSKDRLAFEELGTREVDRLFSTLEPCEVSGFRQKPSNVLSAAALIGGTAVGAGILALPAATLQAGVLPSSVALVMM